MVSYESAAQHALRRPQRRLLLAPPRLGAKLVSKSRLCAKFGGFDLHAAVTVPPYDRRGLERLCRYLCRPALSHERLERLDGDHVVASWHAAIERDTQRTASSALVVGAALAVGVLIAGPLTGAAFNPARAFGPAAVAGGVTGQWLYWAAPLLGGIMTGAGMRLALPSEDG